MGTFSFHYLIQLSMVLELHLAKSFRVQDLECVPYLSIVVILSNIILNEYNCFYVQCNRACCPHGQLS